MATQLPYMQYLPTTQNLKACLSYLFILLVLFSACQSDEEKAAESKKQGKNAVEEKPVSTPEKTLSDYYEYLSKYNMGKVKGLLYDPYTEYHLPRPIIVNNYTIDEKKTLSQAEADAIALTPPLQAGDIQLMVSEIRDGKAQDYLYWFREKREEWRIFGWALKNAYIEVEDDP